MDCVKQVILDWRLSKINNILKYSFARSADRDARKYKIKKYEKKSRMNMNFFFILSLHTRTLRASMKWLFHTSYFIILRVWIFLLNKNSNEVYQPNTTHSSSEIYIILLYFYLKCQATNNKQIIIILLWSKSKIALQCE